MSFYMVCYFLGGSVGAALGGPLHSVYGWYTVLVLSALFLAAGLFIALRRARTKPAAVRDYPGVRRRG